MTTQTGTTPLQVAASQQRNRIPTDWLLEFNDWTDEALMSLAMDQRVTNRDVKAYATWELDFRNVFGLNIDTPAQPPRPNRVWDAAESVKALMGEKHD